MNGCVSIFVLWRREYGLAPGRAKKFDMDVCFDERIWIRKCGFRANVETTDVAS